MTKVIVTAPAKINLFLDITGVTENGYHAIDTVMQSVDLCDTVTITKRHDAKITVECDYPGIPQNEDNIAYKAAMTFFKQSGIPFSGLDIAINKIIPAQAGLAGGSADAAAVITGLNVMYNAGFSAQDMCKIGAEVGADVPFCIVGGCMRARGIGEVFTPLTGLPDCTLLIAKPEFGVDTKEAYMRYDTLNIPEHDPAAMLSAIISGSLKDIGSAMYNVFEQVCGTSETVLVRDIFAQSGALGSALTGSGSAIAAIFSNESAIACKSILAENGIASYTTRPLNHGVKIIDNNS